jgi:putative hydrolase of HD superfamily
MHTEEELAAILALLQQGNQLKRTVRTGWAQRGIPQPENVAAHSFGVAFIALVLSQLVAEPIDTGKLLAMAVLHDLPEALTSDIPSPAWSLLPPGIKPETERRAMEQALGSTPVVAGLMALWEELEGDETAEAKLLHDADRLELFLQAANYEEETGNRKLGEFWVNEPVFHFLVSHALFQAIRVRVDRE